VVKKEESYSLLGSKPLYNEATIEAMLGDEFSARFLPMRTHVICIQLRLILRDGSESESLSGAQRVKM
jgi:hypothetical protein